MANSPSIDKHFLKALELSGSKRRAFMRTLPAETRAKVSALLAADESVAKKEFLEGGFHESQAGEDQPRRVAGRRSVDATSNRREPAEAAVGKNRKSTQKTRTASKRNNKHPAGSKSPRRTRNKKKNQQKNGPGFAVIAMTATAVVACVGLVWLIVNSLRSEPMVVADSEPRSDTNMAAMPEAQEATPVAAVESSAVETQAEDEVSPEVVAAEPTFYTAATAAPPLTQKELLELPKAMSPAALVTSPRQLPGVRAWTIDTVGFRNGVDCMDLSRDGNRIAVGCGDGNVRIIDGRLGERQRIIALEDGLPRWIHWDSTSQFLFVSVRAGDVRSLVRVDTLAGRTTHKVQVDAQVFSVTQDGQSLYVNRDGRLQVLNADDLTPQESLEIPAGHGQIRLSQDDRFVMTGSADSLTIFRNQRPLEVVLTSDRNAGLAVSSWSPDGKLASGWTDGMVVVYDPENSGVAGIVEINAHDGTAKHGKRMCCRAWLNDDVVLTTGPYNSVKLVSVSRRAVVQKQENDGHYAFVCYRPEFRRGAIGGASVNELTAARVGRRLLAGHRSHLRSVCYTAEGSRLLVGGNTLNEVRLDPGARTRLATRLEAGAQSSRLDCSHEQYVIVIRDEFALLLDRITGKVLQQWDFGKSSPLQMRWADNQSRVAIPCGDGSVFICTPGNPKPWPLPIPPEAKIQTTLWNPTTQKTLLIGATEIHEWDPTTNDINLIGTHEVEAPYNAVWNPSRTHMAMGGRPVTILNGTTFKPEVVTDIFTHGIKWLSDDELIMVSYRGDLLHSVRISSPETIVDTSTRAMIYGGQWSSSFSPTAPVIAGIYPGNQVRYLDVRNGADLGTLALFGEEDHATIAPDGRILQMTAGVPEQIVYQIRTDRGQETLRPAEFMARFGKYLSP